LLCLGGERRGEEAKREHDREPDPPHAHIGWMTGQANRERAPQVSLS
jgi:hypothetical protein